MCEYKYEIVNNVHTFSFLVTVDPFSLTYPHCGSDGKSISETFRVAL